MTGLGIVAIGIVSVACGSGDQVREVPGPSSAITPSDDGTRADDSARSGPDPDPEEPGAGGSEYPLLQLVAHGESRPNTFGPQCALGIEGTASEVFRVTVPPTWEYATSAGGTGSSRLTFEVDGAEVAVMMAANASDGQAFGEVDLAAEVGTADLGERPVQIVEAAVDEGSSGYAIVDVTWMTNLPDGVADRAMTVLVVSADPGLPTVEDCRATWMTARWRSCTNSSSRERRGWSRPFARPRTGPFAGTVVPASSSLPHPTASRPQAMTRAHVARLMAPERTVSGPELAMSTATQPRRRTTHPRDRTHDGFHRRRCSPTCPPTCRPT